MGDASVEVRVSRCRARACTSVPALASDRMLFAELTTLLVLRSGVNPLKMCTIRLSGRRTTLVDVTASDRLRVVCRGLAIVSCLAHDEPPLCHRDSCFAGDRSRTSSCTCVEAR